MSVSDEDRAYLDAAIFGDIIIPTDANGVELSCGYGYHTKPYYPGQTVPAEVTVSGPGGQGYAARLTGKARDIWDRVHGNKVIS